mgnify:CR=1 FL=1
MCVAEPPPAEPYCIFAAFAFTAATNSGIVLAGKSLRRMSTLVFSSTTPTGANSASEL